VANSFDVIVSGEESWFIYLYPSDRMLASCKDEVAPREQRMIAAETIMLTIFFTSRQLIALECLPPRQQLTQEYFASQILPDLRREQKRFCCGNRARHFCINIDNSIYYNRQKVNDEIFSKKVEHLLHLAYLPSLNRCGFWLFEILENEMKDRPGSHGINAFAPHDIQTSEKVFVSGQKARLFEIGSRNDLCDYREFTEQNFNFLHVSSLSYIFHYRSTLVIGNMFFLQGSGPSRQIESGFSGLSITNSRSKPRYWKLSRIINLFHIY
jgi:hypothetical protein